MMKRLLSICILLMAACITASAEYYDFKVNDIYYKINSDGTTVSVTRKSVSTMEKTYWGDVIIPSTVTYNGTVYTVTKIAKQAFTINDLVSVTLPPTITTIGERAFASCNDMVAVLGGGGVTSIGDAAFSGCDSLKRAFFGENVLTIGDEAFINCTVLKEIQVGNKLTTIGQSAFSRCLEMRGVNLTNNIQSIGESAFYACWYNFENGLVIPSTLTTIPRYAFESCHYMSSLKIPSSVTRIERGAFYNAGTSGLKSLTIPGSVKYLGRNAFTNLRECTSLTISNGVDSIDIYCFSRLCSLQSVTIPSSVKWIGKRAFQDCEKLSTVNYNATDCAGITFSQNDSSWFFAAPITKVTIGESVKTIPHNLMFNQTKLASVTIPGTVTSIGANAFAGCTNLMDIYVAHKAPVLLSADIANAPVHAKAFVHVPEGCDKYYKGRDYWKNFQYIFDDNGTYQPAAEGDINHDGVVNVSDVAALINKILGK